MRYWLPRLAIATLVFALAACGDDDADPTATPPPSESPAATATSNSTATEPPDPTATTTTPPGFVEAPSVVQLIDVATGEVHTLYESLDALAHDASFLGDRVLVRAGDDVMLYGLDGEPVSGDPPDVSFRPCFDIEGEEICGYISPDRRWLLYESPQTPDPGSLEFDMYLLDLETNESRLVQAGLFHCGGCDFRYGPRWSPSGRYVVFAPTGGEASAYLTDIQSAATRQIAAGNQLSEAPEWAPDGDRLLYAAGLGEPAYIEDLGTGTTLDLGIPWPAAFDRSGTLVYSPAWGEDKSTGQVTTIVGAASGEVVATLPGAPPGIDIWRDNAAVDASSGTTIAALRGADGCDGIAIYRDGALTTCAEGGVDATIGPDGSVVVGRRTGTAGPARGPNFETLDVVQYDIDLVEAAGSSRSLLTGTYGLDFAPQITWNAAGTHILVRYPLFLGL